MSETDAGERRSEARGEPLDEAAGVGRSEAEMRACFEGALDAIFIADDEGRFVAANRAACELTGRSERELLGKTAGDLAEPGFDFAAARRAFLEGGAAEGELVVQRPSGERRWTEYRSRAHVAPGRHLTVVRDITERRRSEERLRALVQAAPVSLIAVDREGRITVAEGRDLERLVHRAGEARRLVGSHLRDVLGSLSVPGAGLVAAERALERVLEGETVEGLTATDERAFEVRMVPKRTFGGGVSGALAVVTDVTERRRLERELRQAQKVEAMGRLSAGIAHDMNNVLMAIVGAADRAARCTDEPERVRERLEEIRQVAEGGAAVVRRLTHFARDGGGVAAVELDAVVRDVVVMLRPLLGDDVELAVVLDAAGAYAPCDAGRLEQVVVNLAVNARDAMPGGGRLEVTTERTGRGAIRLVVRDSGDGMEATVARNVFEPFFTTKEDGSGLGLSVVKSIVEECEGHVEVRSEVGRGTVFVVELPRAQGIPRRFEEAERLADLPPRTVLLVENDALVRRAARSFLERGGHRVLEAADAHEALCCAREPGVDVMITDVVLPSNVSGPELAARVQAERPQTRVLLMSGYSHHELVKRGRISPEAFVLQKPFSQRELHAALACLAAPGFEPELGDEGPQSGEERVPPVVLWVEEQPSVRDALAHLLGEAGYDVRASASLGGAPELRDGLDEVDVLVLSAPGREDADSALVDRLLAERSELGLVLLVDDEGEGAAAFRTGPNVRVLRRPAGTSEIVEAIEAVRRPDASRCA
jgi:PAS domain S-box-containing protein